MKKIGVSLSGGGVKALLYTGMLQAFEDNNIQIEVIAGISGGALVASLYASGYSGKQILDIAKTTDFFKLISRSSVTSGELIDHKLLEITLNQFIKAKNFEELNKKLVIFCSDIDTKEQVVINSGELINAVIASCALPPVIKPVIRDERRLVDGGFSTTYGSEALRKKGAEYVIGVSVEKWLDVSTMPGIMKDFVDAMGVAWQTVASSEQKNEPTDLIITDFGDNTNMLDFKVNKQELFDKGYKKTMQYIDMIKNQTKNRRTIFDFIFQ